MTVNEILNYISASPYSANIQVLRSMLEELQAESEPVKEEIAIEDLIVSKNGMYTAPAGKAYGKVIVNVKQPKSEDK